ncbi:ABC transporter permease [Gracilibacillus marinus]|uniref:Putative hemin transport system permease protein HrtB n=1 Tax=Gracilibacillus marinus TaxID=630535 RepID=A0ABV8VRW0_9BACI
MNIGWKEIKRNKLKFFIIGSIVFLVSLLTFIISGLASGLSQDNAALIKDMPDGEFYMTEEAEETYTFSKIDKEVQTEILTEQKDAVAFSIQMGFFHDDKDKQRSVAFVTSTESTLFETVHNGEIILDQSLEKEGIRIGDRLTSEQFSGEFIVKGFVNQKKFSHAPVAYISNENFQEMYRTESMQFLFLPSGTINEDLGLQVFNKDELLQTLPSYRAEQMSLNMIIAFLIIISGLLFAIFFYMMNVQKIGLYGILKAIGIKTRTLFTMMWTQMIIITIIALALSTICSQLFQAFGPSEMPFYLTTEATIQLSIIFFVVGFIGATISALQIKKVEPLRAIQQGEM